MRIRSEEFSLNGVVEIRLSCPDRISFFARLIPRSHASLHVWRGAAAGRAYCDFDELIPATPETKLAANDCAPACAVALLASETPVDHK